MANLRIATTRSQDLQPLAVAGQTGIEAWRTLHDLLLRELSPAHAALLAEPVANEALGQVDWYAAGDGPAPLLQDLPDPARSAAQARLHSLVADIEALSARLGASRAGGDRFVAEMLGLALRLPGPGSVHVVGGQPVLAGWGHAFSGGRGGVVVLTGMAAAAQPVQAPILPPPPSPYAAAAPARRWLPGVLAASLLAPVMALLLAWRDPLGWFAPDVPLCRLEPGQLGLAQGLGEEVAREGVLRAELARLSADAGQRRLMCPPPAAPPAPPPQAAAPPPPSDTARAERRGAQGGKVQVILAWDDRNDLDLAIACPGGGEINFIRRQACGGTLDVDANGDVGHLTASPLENVYFSNPQPGRYRVIVDPYGMRERAATPFRVTIRREGHPDEMVTGVAQNGRRGQVVAGFTVDAP